MNNACKDHSRYAINAFVYRIKSKKEIFIMILQHVNR
jgi:hypothetical protein